MSSPSMTEQGRGRRRQRQRLQRWRKCSPFNSLACAMGLNLVWIFLCSVHFIESLDRKDRAAQRLPSALSDAKKSRSSRADVGIGRDETGEASGPGPAERGDAGRRRGERRSQRGGGADASHWTFDRSDALRVQRHLFRATRRTSPPLTAYVEPPLPPPPPDDSTVPRLRPRAHAPEDLRRHAYGSVRSCSDLPGGLPVGHPRELDAIFGGDAHRRDAAFPRRRDYAACCCPVDADPFLPWLHDAFPADGGAHVELVAHNRRLCNTDPGRFRDDLDNLEAQVALLQAVPLRRVDEREAAELAPELWRPGRTAAGRDDGDGGDDGGYPFGEDAEKEAPPPRYRLASHEEADADALETRFICRFRALRYDGGGGGGGGGGGDDSPAVRSVVVGETLSVYPYNYELANLRKPYSKPMLVPPGHRAMREQIWNSVLHFRCPVPAELRSMVADGSTVVEDVATLYLDVVPVRTHPRRDKEGYIPGLGGQTNFTPDDEWGRAHVLPRVEASGRWANIPICFPPNLNAPDNKSAGNVVPTAEQAHAGARRRSEEEERRPTGRADDGTAVVSAARKPRHFLIGCLWASATYTTRVSDVPDASTSERLLEWLTYHLHVAGFDRIYVYDNTGAHTNLTSLAPVTDLFPPRRVTRLDWPHRVCNNNRPADANPGERSSQYAAEASCRLRYGPDAEWLAGIDADEYLVPMGNWTDLREWLREGVGGSRTNILSFFSTRASPNVDFMRPYYDGKKCGRNMQDAKCLAKRADSTFLETYNCDRTPLPKPDWGWRAKKQIYRPRFVLNHYVHYTTVTRRLLDFPSEMSPRFKQPAPYERRVDERREAFMLHAKTRQPTETVGWKERCARSAEDCPVGIAWPMTETRSAEAGATTEDGMKYSCHRHERVAREMVPKLKEAMAPLLARRRSMESNG